MGPAGGSGSRLVVSHRIEVSNQQLLQEVQKSSVIKNSGMIEKQESIQDIRARKFTQSNKVLIEDGHYKMGLLWKHDDQDMPNRPMAESRLASLKRRLAVYKEMHKKYIELIEGYISKWYAEPVNSFTRPIRLDLESTLPTSGTPPTRRR